ncbi:tetratricopeptide repeat protein [Thermococcus sp.]
MVIKYEPLNRRERIVRLFREAIEAENARDLKKALKILDEILELSKEDEPEFYFEACFRMADVHIQMDNYRGAVKCALRGILRAPSNDHYRLGVKRLGDILFILKEEGRLEDITENMEPTLSLIKDDEELHRFTLALIRLAQGEKVEENFLLREFNEVIESLRDG